MINILIDDSGSLNYYQNSEYFATIDQWAQQFCPSYAGYTVKDVSYVRLQWSSVATYQFREDKDAHWFVLKWK